MKDNGVPLTPRHYAEKATDCPRCDELIDLGDEVFALGGVWCCVDCFAETLETD